MAAQAGRRPRAAACQKQNGGTCGYFISLRRSISTRVSSWFVRT
jgi:hypothetical protein